MTQYARPDGDITTTGIGGGSYASINESSANDADFIYGNENTSVTYECSLSNITDPSVNTAHTFSYRVVKLNNTTPDGEFNACYVTASLYQGSTLICADTQKKLDGTWTTYSKTLSTAEADTITDYTDLRLRFVSPASGGSPSTRRAMGLSWAEFQTPDAAVTDDMTALDILYGTPAIETPTIGQKHALTSVDVVSGTPAMELATLGQKHALKAVSLGNLPDRNTSLSVTTGRQSITLGDRNTSFVIRGNRR